MHDTDLIQLEEVGEELAPQGERLTSFDQRRQQFKRRFAHVVQRLADGSQRRIDLSRLGNIIEANDRHIAAHGEAAPFDGIHDAEGHHVLVRAAHEGGSQSEAGAVDLGVYRDALGYGWSDWSRAPHDWDKV